MTMDLTTTAASAVRTTDLENLAERIDAEHERCASAMRASLHHALEAGRLLLEAKAALPHGAWLPWLRDNCSVHPAPHRAGPRDRWLVWLDDGPAPAQR